MMKKTLLVILLGVAVQCQIYSVDFHLGRYILRQGNPQQNTLAWGHYEHEVEKDGWGKLYITTSSLQKGHQFSVNSHFAAGFLEGALTSSHIWDHYWSWWDYTFHAGTTPPTEATEKWVFDQEKYSRQLIADNPNDEYYQALARIQAQNDGLYLGIQTHGESSRKLSKIDLLYLQGCGDMYEIIPATVPSQKIDWKSLYGEELKWTWEQTVSCSAMVKSPADWSDVIVGHTTWTSYSNMLRVYKYYNFQGGPKPYRVSFSAKPGLLYSKDDFYVLPNQNLVVMETTNGIMDTGLYDLVFPQSLLTWQRVPMANQLATNGDQWTDIFIKHNSGTYNNQYIVVDMKTVQNNVQPQSGFIWISETMPGLAKRHDVTQQFISNGNVWPSYNIPFDLEIYAYAGFQQAFEKTGDYYSYSKCPRAQIFSRDHQKADNLSGFQKLIRYNDYKQDPVSQNNPAYAIASRYDLRSPNPKAFGAIDAKITTKYLTQLNQAWIQSGPSYDTQPQFTWGNNWTDLHLGQPETFHFDWVLATESKMQYSINQ